MKRVRLNRWLIAAGLIAAPGVVAFGQSPVWHTPAEHGSGTPEAPWHTPRPAPKPVAEVTASAPAVLPAAMPGPQVSAKKPVPVEVMTTLTWWRAGTAMTVLPASDVVPASAALSPKMLPLPVVVMEVTAPAPPAPSASPAVRRVPVALPRMPHGYQDPTHPVGPEQSADVPPPTVSVVRDGK